MRWRPLLLTLGLTAFALALSVVRASSSHLGRDLWKVRLDETSSDHWDPLDTGHIRLNGRATAVFLLAHAKAGAPAGHYDAMKVVGGADGSSLWTYDAAGSNYVDASGPGQDRASDAVRSACAPRFMDVDGDGSDDVVFVEQDFALGQLLRAVRIEP